MSALASKRNPQYTWLQTLTHAWLLGEQVGYSRMNATEAKGIPLARHLAASHFNGQDFFMQVSSRDARAFAKPILYGPLVQLPLMWTCRGSTC